MEPQRRLTAHPLRAAAEAGLLERMAEHLASTEPVDAIGVARARVLMRDGAGPLYEAVDRHSLRASLLSAIDTLEPHADGDPLCEDWDPDERGRGY